MTQQAAITAGLARAKERAMADEGVVVPTNGNGNGDDKCKDRREYQFLIGGCLITSVLVQALLVFVMLRLGQEKPYDWVYQIAKDLFTHFSVLDVGLMGGLLGMAQAKRP
jgi:hypothetical protein